MKTTLLSFHFILLLLLFSLLQFSDSQKTATKSAKKDALKKKAHEAAMKEAKKNSASLKTRKQTMSDKIHQTVKDNIKKV
jgi:hypothetical protein